jgi:hypothetical protein
MPSILEIREKFPMYSDVPDLQLVDALHQKFYADIPKADFYKQTGIAGTASQIPGTITLPPKPEKESSFMARVAGLPETAATIISGSASGLAGQAAGIFGGKLGQGPNVKLAEKVMEAGTYQPTSEGAQANLQSLGAIGSALPAFVPAVGQAGQIAQTANALAARATPAAQRAVQTVRNALVRTPEPQMAGGGAALTQEALLRAERAQRQGIPLTKGEQLQSLSQQQLEQDLIKSGEPKLVAPLTNLKQQQQEAIGRQFQKLTEATGAQMADTDPIFLREIGKIVDKPLMAEYQRSFNNFKDKYKLADTSGETLAPAPYKPIIDFIESKTVTEREKLDPVLSAVAEQLVKNDPEGTKTVPVRTMDDIYQLVGKYPNSAHSKEIKNLIDQATEGVGGDLYRQARAARKQFAKEFEDVSAVAGLVSSKGEDRKVRISGIFNDIVLDSSLEDLQSITKLLKRAGPEGERAMSELKGQTVQWLKGQATGISGITKADSLRRAIDKLEIEDKLTELFGKSGREEILDLRDTIKDALVKKSGAENTSNTANAVLRGLEKMSALKIPGAKTLAEMKQASITKQQAKEAATFNALAPANQNKLVP